MNAGQRQGAGGRFGLAELVDLEVQLDADRDASDGALSSRDRGIALRWTRQPQSRSALLSAWLRDLPDRKGHGRKVERGHRLTAWLVFFAFVLIGVGVAMAVLQFTGDHPINVLIVLAIFVFLQLLNLVATLVAVFWSKYSPDFFAQLPLVALVKGLLARLIGSEAAGRWMGRRSLYREVERWVLFRLMQIGAVGFNVGAIVTFLSAVTFSDLAFAWSTTLQLGAEQLHRACLCLAAPWQAWLPSAVPSFDLVQATQYFRIDSAYVNAPAGSRVQNAAFAGGWWPFLLMSLLVYGLLPRAITTVIGHLGLKRTFERLSLDTPDVQEVIMRLTTPTVRRVDGDDPGNVSPMQGEVSGASLSLGDNTAGLLVVWREAEFEHDDVARRVKERFGVTVGDAVAAAGGHDYAADEALVSRLAAGAEPMVVVAEPWNAPDRAFKRLVAQIRQSGTERAIIVVLTDGGDAQDRQVWAGYLAELSDAYLALVS